MSLYCSTKEDVRCFHKGIADLELTPMIFKSNGLENDSAIIKSLQEDTLKSHIQVAREPRLPDESALARTNT